MSSRKRLSFKEKAMILEESSKPNFDKRKICKDFGISKSMIYKILKEKQSILAMNEQKNVANFKKFGRSVNDELKINIYNSIHELELIGLIDKIQSSSKNQPKITGFLLK